MENKFKITKPFAGNIGRLYAVGQIVKMKPISAAFCVFGLAQSGEPDIFTGIENFMNHVEPVAQS